MQHNHSLTLEVAIWSRCAEFRLKIKFHVNFISNEFLIPISTRNCNQIFRGCVRYSPYFTWCKWYYCLIFVTFLVFCHKGGKIIFLLLSWFPSWNPIMRDRLTREKQTIFINMYNSCIPERYWGKVSNSKR